MAKLAVTVIFGRHVGIGAWIAVSVVAPVDEVVAGVGTAVTAVPLRRNSPSAGCAGDLAVSPGSIGQGVGVDGEVGGDRIRPSRWCRCAD